MIPEEYKPLIKKLREATEDLSRSWNTTSDENKFNMSVGANTATVRYYTYEDYVTGNYGSGIKFEILNWAGETVDGFHIISDEPDYKQMYEFYEMARRNALKVDQTISQMLNDLDNL